ncbi:MAG: putative acyl-CoA dehydrogenase, partial [Elusimicrobia bacterium]
MLPAPEYQGAAGLNFFTADRLLQAILTRLLPPDARARELESLTAFGELCGGRLGQLIEQAHREENLPRLVKYDRWGARIDMIEYCSEQLAARRMVVASGVLPPRPPLVRAAMNYLLNQNGEGGITCPLAMTDGLITLLEDHGTPEQKRRWLSLLRDPGGPTPLTAGQFVTERQGGSNVGANETRAEQGADGRWRLTGLKWFCSNPGELSVTTAKPVGSDRVALFLMMRRLADGRLNEAHLLRLKEITGTRGKATAEVEYRGAEAELIGRASHGMALLLRTVLKTSRINT